MKKEIVVKILLILSVALVSAYLVAGALVFKPAYGDTVCDGLRISIDARYKLVSKDEIKKMLTDCALDPRGQAEVKINEAKIEKCLEDNPLIESAECYVLPNNHKVQIEVKLKEPVFMVGGKESYYVDKDRKVMPLSEYSAAYLPVVTGRVTKTMACGEMFDFIQFISQDELWNAQIEQVYVRDDLKIELIPRVSDAVIFLGSLKGYKDKLDRVRQLYEQGFNTIGWNKYSKLNLEYDGQIVCTKVK